MHLLVPRRKCSHSGEPSLYMSPANRKWPIQPALSCFLRASFFVTGSIRVQLCRDAVAPNASQWSHDFWEISTATSGFYRCQTSFNTESWNIMDWGLSENCWYHLQIMAIDMGRIRMNMDKLSKLGDINFNLAIRWYETWRTGPMAQNKGNNLGIDEVSCKWLIK